jgi:hypothetical protein
MSDAKKWAIATMLIIVLVASVIFVITPSNATPLVMEIQNYRVLYGMGEKLDIGPVAKQHIKMDMRPKDVMRLFEKSGFMVNKSLKKGKFDGKRYDMAVIANFVATGVVPAMSTKYQFTVYFKNQKPVRTVGNVIKDKKPSGFAVAANDKGEDKVNLK